MGDCFFPVSYTHLDVYKRQQEIDHFAETMPEGFELQTIYDQGYESAVANQGFILNLIISVVTVVAILLFFIGFKNGILIGSGLVFSIFATLIVMLSQGIALQRMSPVSYTHLDVYKRQGSDAS